MKWGGGTRWRKAWIVSVILHSIVLISAGWMIGKALLPVDKPEPLIELELTNEPDSPPGADATATAPAAVPVASTAAIRSQPVQQPVSPPAVVPEAVTAEAVVAVSSMSVESVDTSAAASDGAAAGDGAGGSGSGLASGSGSGSGSGTGSGAGSGSGSSSREIIPPGIYSRREPAYPEQARREGIEGTVVLRIEILANGRAGDVSVSRSSGSELLDEAAVDAVQRWRFVPAKIRGTGQSVPCQTTMPVVFRLKT